MSKQRTGVAIFAGLLVITGIASSGWLFDANSLLDRYVKTPLMESREEALPTGVEVAEEETATEAENAAVSEEKAEGEATATEEAAAPEVESTEEAAEATEPEPEPQEETASQQPETEVEPEQQEETASQQPETEAEPEQQEAATEAEAEQEPAQTEVAETVDQPAPADESTVATPTPAPPVFDLLRVEPNGDMVVAGVAQPGAELELVTGAETLTNTTANDRGEFVAILDVPLEPGDYEIVLRATGPDGVVMSSEETAIVSIPENGTDGVIALVEAPGEPSRLITVPETEIAQAEEQPAESEQEAEAEVAQEPEGTESETPAVETAEVEQPEAEAEKPVEATDQKIRIEAVEIDGPTVFVAGAAAPGTKLRVYANEILLGDTEASAQGRFLIEVNRDLPVGDYIIRADALASNGADVVMRAAVPFTRSAGEKLAAVAVPVAPRLPDEAPQIETVVPASGSTDSSVEASTEQDTTQAAAADSSAQNTGQSGTQQAASANSESEATLAPTDQSASTETASAQVQGTTLDQPLTPVENSVVIRRGDTLWHISRRVYGRGIKYTTIYRANEDQIRDPDMIWPGQVFALPEKADDPENQ